MGITLVCKKDEEFGARKEFPHFGIRKKLACRRRVLQHNLFIRKKSEHTALQIQCIFPKHTAHGKTIQSSELVFHKLHVFRRSSHYLTSRRVMSKIRVEKALIAPAGREP